MEPYLSFTPLKKANERDRGRDVLYLVGYKKILVLEEDDNKYVVPSREYFEDMEMDLKDAICIGENDGITYFCKRLEEIDSYAEAIEFKEFRNAISEKEYSILSRALTLLFFIEENNRCGRCGGYMVYKKEDHDIAMVCSECNHAVWPKVSPAVIVAVTKEDKILLGHNRFFADGVYSLISGFMEMGESFEDTVKREVFEETGIKVSNIRYACSQMWPFPNSYMIGFTADYLDGEIKVDEDEIMDAKWFAKDEIPEVYAEDASIASVLMQDYINNK